MKESHIDYAETDLSRCQRASSHMKLAFSTLGCPAWNIETVAEAVVRFGYDSVEWPVVDGSILSPGTPAHTLPPLVPLTRASPLSLPALAPLCHFVTHTPCPPPPPRST